MNDLVTPSRRSLIVGAGAAMISSQAHAATAAQDCLLFLCSTKNKSYLGQVATRVYMHDDTTGSTSGWNARTAHYARTSISNPQIICCNFGANATSGEVGSGGTHTITASIEYPAGTFYQVKFSGNTSVVLANLNYVVSDPVPGVKIPNGALFFVRRYIVPSVALLFSNSGKSRHENTSLGDSVDNSGIDKTLGGTITNQGASMIPLQGIVANTSFPSIGAFGSSRMSGFQDSVTDATGNTGYTRMFGGNFAYMDYSSGGDRTIVDLGSGGILRQTLIKTYCSHLWIDPGLNDLNAGGQTAAAVMSSITSFAATWPGGLKKVIVNNEATWTASTDGWTTTTNQTVEPFEGQREVLNSSIGALSGYNQIVDANSFMGNGVYSQFWNNPAVGGSQFTIDGIHENSPTLVNLAASNKFNSNLIKYP